MYRWLEELGGENVEATETEVKAGCRAGGGAVGGAEVYISPKINISSRTPKMALHETPGTPCPWIVIFLHGP